MKPKFARQFARQAPTKAKLRAALKALLVMRETLDGLDADSLARSYGMEADDVRKLIAEEQRRRAG